MQHECMLFLQACERGQGNARAPLRAAARGKALAAEEGALMITSDVSPCTIVATLVG